MVILIDGALGSGYEGCRIFCEMSDLEGCGFEIWRGLCEDCGICHEPVMCEPWSALEEYFSTTRREDSRCGSVGCIAVAENRSDKVF